MPIATPRIALSVPAGNELMRATPLAGNYHILDRSIGAFTTQNPANLTEKFDGRVCRYEGSTNQTLAFQYFQGGQENWIGSYKTQLGRRVYTEQWGEIQFSIPFTFVWKSTAQSMLASRKYTCDWSINFKWISGNNSANAARMYMKLGNDVDMGGTLIDAFTASTPVRYTDKPESRMFNFQVPSDGTWTFGVCCNTNQFTHAASNIYGGIRDAGL